MLAAENYTIEQLAGKVEREWPELVEISGRNKEFLILELKPGTDRKGLLAKLAGSDMEVERFGRYEPSLNDIFVKKVGEEE